MINDDLFGSFASQGHPDRYGIPYVGSKSKIARDIVDVLPRSKNFVDLFAGGGAITHAAMLSCKWENFIANDIGDAIRLFYECITGGVKDARRIVSREQFFRHKDRDAIVRLLWSFGNKGDSYIWSEDIEPIKLSACKMIMADTIRERRLAYMDFVKKLIELERLQGLERIQSIERLESIERLAVSQKDYNDVEIPDDATVYCDPPYFGTDEVNEEAYGISFDHFRFFDWCREINRPVYVSNYNMPDDFVSIWEKKKQCMLSSSGNSQRIERLYILKKWVA